jgi:hypothetical protein
MRSTTAILVMILLFVTVASAQNSPDAKGMDNHKFNKAEYLPATSGGQIKAGNPVKGTLFFNNDQKTVNFLQESGSSVLDIKYDAIKGMTYEKASKPRYAEAVLVSPLFLLSHAKKHYLTFQYTDPVSNEGKYAIVHLDKKNAREAVACAEAQTGKKVEQVEEK